MRDYRKAFADASVYLLGLLVAIVCGLVWIYESEVRQAKRIAFGPQVVQFGRAHFNGIDCNHDGMLTDKELTTPGMVPISKRDLELLAHIRGELSWMGHRPTAKERLTLPPSERHWYVLNKRDLENYRYRLGNPNR